MGVTDSVGESSEGFAGLNTGEYKHRVGAALLLRGQVPGPVLLCSHSSHRGVQSKVLQVCTQSKGHFG